MSWHRHVFATMGTVASLKFESATPERVDLPAVHRIFDHYDATFSLYKPNSELSRIAAGQLGLADASVELRDAYATALEWRAATHGEFTPHRPDGVIDLSGVVKAIAMERARAELSRTGVARWCLNVGGDILAAGTDERAEAWHVGIVDPLDRNALVTSATLRGSRRACATSGTAERGDHIWTVGAIPAVFLQATVMADDIVTADVLATAIIAGGSTALDEICATWDIDAMTVDTQGMLRMTPRFSARIPSDR
jgi:thiamine biosynthesis lipoprotein